MSSGHLACFDCQLRNARTLTAQDMPSRPLSSDSQPVSVYRTFVAVSCTINCCVYSVETCRNLHDTPSSPQIRSALLPCFHCSYKKTLECVNCKVGSSYKHVHNHVNAITLHKQKLKTIIYNRSSSVKGPHDLCGQTKII